MPCYTAPHSYCHHGVEDVDDLICEVTSRITKFDKTRKREEGEFQELKKYADQVTDMLCRTMQEIEYQEPGIIVDDDIKEWYEKHKAWDKSRKDKK